MKLTDAEWKVMNVIWDRYPITAREVLDRLGDETDWAYTTTKTVLARLVGKGALRMSMDGNTSLYEPLVTREDARHSEVRSVIERAFGGALSPLMHFLVTRERLTEKERAELERLLEEQKREKGR